MPGAGVAGAGAGLAGLGDAGRAADGSVATLSDPATCVRSRSQVPLMNAQASIGRVTVGDYPEGIMATADGQRIIVANWESNTLSIIDAVEVKVVGEVKVGDGPRAFGVFLRR